MAFLDKNEREQLRNELLKLPFNRAKGKVRGMDTDSRLVFLRNVQNVDQWYTRYDLPSFGVRVTLIEHYDTKQAKSGKIKSDYKLVDVRVEPTPENKT
jgi:hypothetical protein